MKGKSFAFYVSVAFNVALLVLVLWPGGWERTAQAQVAARSGNLVAASIQAGSSRDALWVADRASGRLLVFDFELNAKGDPLQVGAARDLRADLETRQLGNLMMVPMKISSSRSAVVVIDSDAQRMGVYTYDLNKRIITPLQGTDLRAHFTAAVAVEGD